MDALRRQTLAAPVGNSFQNVAGALSQVLAAQPAVTPVAARASPGAVHAVLMRAGTSRGVFVHGRDLPRARSQWPRILSAAMGSGHGDKRQLDGVGGATSTTSKAAIVAPSTRPDADVDYTFAQVAVGEDKVDLKGSCGNICSGVGPFALDEGLVRATPGQHEAVVRVHDTATGAIIKQTLQVNAFGGFKPDGDHRISGYSGSGSPLRMAWTNPAGTVARKQFFPTGNAADTISVRTPDAAHPTAVRASLIDAANPFVFVDAASLPNAVAALPNDDPAVLRLVEAIRCEAAVMYGLAATPEEAHKTRAIPKIVLVHAPHDHQLHADIRVVPYSMGKPHPSFQLSGTVCMSAALTYPGTVPSMVARKARGLPDIGAVETGGVRKIIAHPSGFSEAVVGNSINSFGRPHLDDVSVVTTARKVFKGEIFVE